jgi:hypothetical protein
LNRTRAISQRSAGSQPVDIGHRFRVTDDREKLVYVLGLGGDLAFQAVQEPALVLLKTRW